jgi:Zn finger protein HypA/HybF involved in hydrogenase expression
MAIEPLLRTLEQEVFALARGASLECLVCGEFVMHRRDAIVCAECGSELKGAAGAALQLRMQAG